MPQDITINGAQYPDVPAVQIPKTGGGIAQFDDTTDATATASEIASGKSAYVNNTRLVGTGQMVEPPLYIDDSINSIGIGEAPTATNYLVNTLNSSFRGQYNNFYSMPYSWSTAGVDNTQGYARIATITARGTASNLAMPIRFEIFRHYDNKPINMYLRLAWTQDYNPSIEGLYYEDNNDGIYNGNFTAFARKTGTGTYDVYVYKETASTWFGVNTYIPAYMLYRMSVSYANDLYTFVPYDAVMATQMHVENTTKYNTFAYMPYSFVTNGGSNTAGYARIATITLTSNYVTAPIEFKVYRRNQKTAITLTVLFGGGSTTDPGVTSLYYEGETSHAINAFIYKSTTSTWHLYLEKTEAYDSFTVVSTVPDYMQARSIITYERDLISSVPSGATIATHLPNLKPTADTYVVRTSGASWVNTLRFTRDGNVCNLYINIKTDGNTASGANIFIGTVNAPKPPQYITATDYVGSTPIVAGISGGNLYVRNTTPNTIPAGTSISFSFVYITDE